MQSKWQLRITSQKMETKGFDYDDPISNMALVLGRYAAYLRPVNVRKNEKSSKFYIEKIMEYSKHIIEARKRENEAGVIIRWPNGTMDSNKAKNE